jgi:hypothetical protein
LLQFEQPFLIFFNTIEESEKLEWRKELTFIYFSCRTTQRCQIKIKYQCCQVHFFCPLKKCTAFRRIKRWMTNKISTVFFQRLNSSVFILFVIVQVNNNVTFS